MARCDRVGVHLHEQEIMSFVVDANISVEDRVNALKEALLESYSQLSSVTNSLETDKLNAEESYEYMTTRMESYLELDANTFTEFLILSEIVSRADVQRRLRATSINKNSRPQTTISYNDEYGVNPHSTAYKLGALIFWVVLLGAIAGGLKALFS